MDLFAALFSFVTLGMLWFFLQRTKAGLGIRASFAGYHHRRDHGGQ